MFYLQIYYSILYAFYTLRSLIVFVLPIGVIINNTTLVKFSYFYYVRRRLASGEGTVSLGVTQSVCVHTEARLHAARRISLGGEGNALYPVFSS